MPARVLPAARGWLAACIAVVAGTGLVGVAPTAGAVGVPTATTLVLASTSTSYGETVTASATVTTTAGAPSGWVMFVVDGVARRTTLGASNVVATSISGLPAGAHQVSATFLPASPTLQDGSSSPTQVLTVAPAATRTRVAVHGKRTTRVTRVAVRVAAAFGTTPTGRVRAQLRRLGAAKRWVRTEALERGLTRADLGTLRQGRYRLVVRYLGDRNHRPSRATRTFRVRPRR